MIDEKSKNDNIYILKHKNISCLVFSVDNEQITQVEIINSEHLPLVFHIKKDENAKKNLQNWISRRIIPASRMKYDRLLECLKISDLEKLEFVLENKALSLTDCYWIKRENSDDNWENINYYKNDFNQDLIDIYLDSTISPEYKNLIPLTPSNTLDGYLPKAWVIVNGERWLYKRSSVENREILNEVICSKILKAIGIECVEYILTDYKGKESSACKCMGNENIDIISANDFTNLYKKQVETDIECVCRALKEIYGNDNKFYEMVEMDYVFANRDRHWSNFSFVRDAETLKYIGFAPIYDNGNSLWYNRPLNKIGTNDDYLMLADTKLFDIKNKILKGRLVIPKEKIKEKLNIILESEYEEERKQRIYSECCRWLDMLFEK